jgi:hypothetical protein
MSSTDRWVYFTLRPGETISERAKHSVPHDYQEVERNIRSAQAFPKSWVVFEWPGLVMLFNLKGNYACVFRPV